MIGPDRHFPQLHPRAALTGLAAVWLAVGGCATGPAVNPSRPLVNAIQVPAAQYDMMWERTVAVLNDYHFTVARESKIEGVVETHYRAGASLFEPWHRDSVGTASRLESTLQSIRRKVFVTFQSAAPGSVMISVRVDKEIEDVPVGTEPAALNARISEIPPGVVTPSDDPGVSRWLPRGTDPALEAELMARIRHGRL